MKNKIMLCLLICVLFIALTGCNKSQKEKIKKLGISNAVGYIENKYSFTPEVITSEVQTKNTDPIPTIKKEYDGLVKVELKYNNKLFEAYITGNEDSNNGFDNYQQEEIISQLLNTIGKYKGEHYSYSFTYGNYKNNSYKVEDDVIYTDKYYDGTNIKDFLETMVLTVNYIDNSNIQNSNNEISLLFEKGTLYLFNFKTRELLNKYQDMDFKYMYNDDRIAEYVNNVVIIRDGQEEIYNY